MDEKYNWEEEEWDADICQQCGCCRYAHFVGSGFRSGAGPCMIKAHNCPTFRMSSSYPSYEGYERLSDFTSEGLIAYRQSLLDKTEHQTSFIERHVLSLLSKKRLSVIEVGTGNGRLLISLAQNDLLECGYGIDISNSRIEFAKDWHRAFQYTRPIMFEVADVLNMKQSPYADLVVCITGCFQYFYPIDPDAPKKVLYFMRQTAKYALFELYKKPPMGCTWRELPYEDPWCYLLDTYEDIGDWVKHTKKFMAPNKEDTRVENLSYYSLPMFIDHLYKAGFGQVHWAVEDSEKMVVLVA